MTGSLHSISPASQEQLRAFPRNPAIATTRAERGGTVGGRVIGAPHTVHLHLNLREPLLLRVVVMTSTKFARDTARQSRSGHPYKREVRFWEINSLEAPQPPAIHSDT